MPNDTVIGKGADWWRGAVIYQVYPRSFADSNGDGIGDLRGIADRMDYIADLGVDGIWVSPFFTSPMKDFGYDVSNYREVDPMFGTLRDFDHLVERAHGLGLKVMIDQVLSHTSDQHPWFVESRASRDNPRADWYVWAEAAPDGSPPNNWMSIFGGTAWQWDARRLQYFMHNFLASQPDLNFHNPAVREAVLADVEFWLQRGVDGFRLDTVNFYVHDQQLRNNPGKPVEERLSQEFASSNPYGYQHHVYDKSRPENLDFLRELRALMDRYPGTTTVGEIGDDHALERMVEYTSGGDKLHMAYTFELLGGEPSAAFVRRTVEALEARIGDGWPCWAMSNHDVRRAISRWTDGGQDARLAATLLAALCSLRGSVCIYEGEELGLPEAEVPYERLQDPYAFPFWPEYKGRDGCRTPMPWQAAAANGGFSKVEPWLPVPAAHQALAADLQAADPSSALNATRRFLAWRREQPALVSGQLELLDAPDGVLSFVRWHGNEELFCAFNLGAEAVRFAPEVNGALNGVDGHGFDGTVSNGTVHLPARSACFARVEP